MEKVGASMRILHVVEKIHPTRTITTAFQGLIPIFVSSGFYYCTSTPREMSNVLPCQVLLLCLLCVMPSLRRLPLNFLLPSNAGPYRTSGRRKRQKQHPRKQQWQRQQWQHRSPVKPRLPPAATAIINQGGARGERVFGRQRVQAFLFLPSPVVSTATIGAST